VLLLENLEPAKKVEPTPFGRPGVIFDGTTGEATTPYAESPATFEEFLEAAGMDPNEFEIIGTPRVSKWQQKEGGEFLTSFRFTFRKKTGMLDLLLLYSEAKKVIKGKKPKFNLEKTTDKALVVLWSDLQVGKVDHRGGTSALIERVEITKQKLIQQVKKEKPSKVVFCDVGDTIENFINANDANQLYTNDLSIMEQVDLATTLAWDTLKALTDYVPEIVYLSVASNHCQMRINKQRVGKGTDDWGVHIGRTLARLALEVGLPITFIEPQPHDESLAVDVFEDGFHVLGLWHGHQSPRPDQVPTWWRQQAFGNQPVAAATIGVSGHFHHLRVVELGSTPRGTSRFWVQAATMDNGSGWWKRQAGEDSQPGLVTFFLEKGIDFTGTVYKL
jgi:hypothetical protein